MKPGLVEAGRASGPAQPKVQGGEQVLSRAAGPSVTREATPTSTPSCPDPCSLRVYSGPLPRNAT